MPAPLPYRRLLLVALPLVLVAPARADHTDDFARKVAEAVGIIESRYVRETSDEVLVNAAVVGLYQQARVEVPGSIRTRLKKLERQGLAEHLALLKEVRHTLGPRKELDNHQDIDAAVQAMCRRLDPRSVYIDPKTLARNRRLSVNGTAQIGLIAQKGPEGDYMVVGTIKGSPAYRVGIEAGDVLVDIHPQRLEETASLRTLDLAAFSDRCVGRPQEPVDVVIRRSNRRLTFHLTYEILHLDTILGYQRRADDSWNYWIDEKAGIAYIRIPHLYGSSTADRLAELLDGLHGVKGLILDLRGNGGGLVNQARGVAELFTDGELFQVVDRTGGQRSIRATTGKAHTAFPMICLVDRETASSAEIIAAALQDHRRAAILGERTFGKGSMQVPVSFDGGELRLTSAYFYRPSGANLDREHLADPDAEPWGITPDRGFRQPLSDKDHKALKKHLQTREWIGARSEFRDTQLESALECLRAR